MSIKGPQKGTSFIHSFILVYPYERNRQQAGEADHGQCVHRQARGLLLPQAVHRHQRVHQRRPDPVPAGEPELPEEVLGLQAPQIEAGPPGQPAPSGQHPGDGALRLQYHLGPDEDLGPVRQHHEKLLRQPEKRVSASECE